MHETMLTPEADMKPLQVLTDPYPTPAPSPHAAEQPAEMAAGSLALDPVHVSPSMPAAQTDDLLNLLQAQCGVEEQPP